MSCVRGALQHPLTVRWEKKYFSRTYFVRHYLVQLCVEIARDSLSPLQILRIFVPKVDVDSVTQVMSFVQTFWFNFYDKVMSPVMISTGNCTEFE